MKTLTMREVPGGNIRTVDYAIFIIFIIAAVLTPTTDPWNQTVFAAPMIGLYLISIGIAWLVGPRRENETSNESHSNNLRLVFAATVIDHARRRRKRLPCELPRNWRGSV
jgi:Sec-independent protein translocase protein (TatC)